MIVSHDFNPATNGAHGLPESKFPRAVTSHTGDIPYGAPREVIGSRVSRAVTSHTSSTCDIPYGAPTEVIGDWKVSGVNKHQVKKTWFVFRCCLVTYTFSFPEH